MKFYSLLILIIGLTFCSGIKNKTSTLSVCNKTGNKIDSIKITSYGVDEFFQALLNDETKRRKINIKAPDNVDGAFTIVIFQKDSIIYSGSFGYFSQRLGVRDKYEINIMKNYSVKEVVNDEVD